MSFEAWPKIERYNKGIAYVTEKIDGTNAQVYIKPIECRADMGGVGWIVEGTNGRPYVVTAGSRNRWVTPGDDNYGFAGWVRDNLRELIKLGEGRHYGEWWGRGIQRGYGLDEKRFSLFNVGRWREAYSYMREGFENDFPKCCHVVPLLSASSLLDFDPKNAMSDLAKNGSYAAPGFMSPEGIVISYSKSDLKYKLTFERTEGKWKDE